MEWVRVTGTGRDEGKRVRGGTEVRWDGTGRKYVDMGSGKGCRV